MAIPRLNRQQSQEVDRRAVAEYGMLGLVLMENAGRGLADKLGQHRLRMGRSSSAVAGEIMAATASSWRGISTSVA